MGIDIKTTGRQKILPGTPHPTDANKVRGYDGRWVTKKHFDQVTDSRKGADEIKAQFDQPTKEVAELSQSQAIDLRLFKEGTNDGYMNGAVRVERIDSDPNMPYNYSIEVERLEDLPEDLLQELELTKANLKDLSATKKLNLLRNNFKK